MAGDRLPTGPIEREPAGGYLAPPDRARYLYGTLAGVELGAWDQRIVEWLAQHLDTPTLITVVSLIERARRVEAATVAADLAGMDRRRREPRAER